MSRLFIFKNGEHLVSNAAFFWVSAELVKRLKDVEYISVDIRKALTEAAEERPGDLDLSSVSQLEIEAIRRVMESFIKEVSDGTYLFFDASFKPGYIDMMLDLWKLIDLDYKDKSERQNPTRQP